MQGDIENWERTLWTAFCGWDLIAFGRSQLSTRVKIGLTSTMIQLNCCLVSVNHSAIDLCKYNVSKTIRNIIPSWLVWDLSTIYWSRNRNQNNHLPFRWWMFLFLFNSTSAGQCTTKSRRYKSTLIGCSSKIAYVEWHKKCITANIV